MLRKKKSVYQGITFYRKYWPEDITVMCDLCKNNNGYIGCEYFEACDHVRKISNKTTELCFAYVLNKKM